MQSLMPQTVTLSAIYSSGQMNSVPALELLPASKLLRLLDQGMKVESDFYLQLENVLSLLH